MISSGFILLLLLIWESFGLSVFRFPRSETLVDSQAHGKCLVESGCLELFLPRWSASAVTTERGVQLAENALLGAKRMLPFIQPRTSAATTIPQHGLGRQGRTRKGGREDGREKEGGHRRY